MVINTNIAAQVGVDKLASAQAQLSKSLTKLSSGTKLVEPSDDAAGAAVSARLDATLKRLDAARNNVGNAISFIQTQDGYLTQVSKALGRMSELAMMAQDVTKQPSDLALYDKEFQELSKYVKDVAIKTFNGVTLFSNATLTVVIDTDPPLNSSFDMLGVNVSSTAYSTAISGDLTSSANALSALTNLRAGFDQLASDRSRIGAYQSRLNYTSDQLQVSKENLMAANSRIKDIDVAEESTQMARWNILNQVGTAMVAQANTLPQSALKLLQQ